MGCATVDDSDLQRNPAIRTSSFSVELKIKRLLAHALPMAADLQDMELFVRAVASGSLSAAGRELGLSPAVASKRLARLESQLGARLLQRSSRRLSLTDNGALYLERCQVILAEVAEAEALLGGDDAQVRGTLRVSATSALGRRWVGPVAAQFAARHPEVSVHLSLSDRLVNLVEAGIDCAVRVGPLADDRLIARKLADNRRVICAAPKYLKAHGTPATPAALAGHACLVLTSGAALHADWRFRPPQGPATHVRVRGRLVSDNGQQIHDWMLAGHGLARRSIWDVADDLAAGRLVEVLREWSDDDAPISVLYASRRHLPRRTRLFIDALAAHFAEASPDTR
jgi:DNA-binding transcriptional LysR family regulator